MNGCRAVQDGRRGPHVGPRVLLKNTIKRGIAKNPIGNIKLNVKKYWISFKKGGEVATKGQRTAGLGVGDGMKKRGQGLNQVRQRLLGRPWHL